VILSGILYIALCAFLWRMGGWGKEDGNPLPAKQWRTVGIPVTLAACLAIRTGIWWIFLVEGALVAAWIVQGYGIPDESDEGSWLGRILKIGWLTRGVWGFLMALAAGLALAILKVLPIFRLVVYVAGSFVLGALLSYFKVKDKYIEPAIGGWIGLVVLLCR